jgi:peptidoglycan/xylan/chitin deacetylase (PgdA/CDA1 family)
VRPTFVLSIDTELVWGSFDHVDPDRFSVRYPDLRGTISRLLAVLDDHRVPATWAVVGHLFLSSCRRGADGRAHPELPRPAFDWYRRDWFSLDPCTDRARDPLWYGDDVVDMILAARVPHEIGSHSFSHPPFGDPGCSEEVAAAEVAECVRLAEARGLTLRSFVFPRNIEGHHRVLREHGFTSYRGHDPVWFHSLPGLLQRAAHLVDQAVAVTPPVASPRQTQPGLWDIPGSMLLMERRGARRCIPLGARVAKGRAGLKRAVREEKVFHLWFHPFNLAPDRERILGALGQILDEAVRLRDRGDLDIRTMGELAASLGEQAGPPPRPSETVDGAPS